MVCGCTEARKVSSEMAIKVIRVIANKNHFFSILEIREMMLKRIAISAPKVVKMGMPVQGLIGARILILIKNKVPQVMHIHNSEIKK